MKADYNSSSGTRAFGSGGYRHFFLLCDNVHILQRMVCDLHLCYVDVTVQHGTQPSFVYKICAFFLR